VDEIFADLETHVRAFGRERRTFEQELGLGAPDLDLDLPVRIDRGPLAAKPLEMQSERIDVVPNAHCSSF
jgi:hypothetical protein